MPSPDLLGEQRDCQTLRTIAADVDRLAAAMHAARTRFGARARGFFLPDEDDEVRRLLVTYRTYRAALLDIVAAHQGPAGAAATPAECRHFLLAFGAAVMLYHWSDTLVSTYRDVPVVREKLNEPEPRWGLPADTFDQLEDGLTNPDNLQRLLAASAVFVRRRHEFARVAAADADFGWLYDEARRQYRCVKRSWREIIPDRLDVELRGLAKRSLAPVQDLGLRLRAAALDLFGNIWLDERPNIPAAHRAQLRALLRPGDVLIVRPERKSSTIFLPGWWTHGAFYYGGADALAALGVTDAAPVKRALAQLAASEAGGGAGGDDQAPCVLEALAAGVVANPLARTLGVDHVAALRPRLAEDERCQAVADAFSHFGKPYDFEFNLTRSDRLVCTELLYRSLHGKGPVRFAPVVRLGHPTLSADDIMGYVLDEYDGARPFELLALSLRDMASGRSDFLAGAPALAAVQRTLGRA